jgi:hypothetical protein
VEFKITKYWLKSFNSTKVIAKAIQKGRLYKLVGVVQSLVANVNIKIKKNDLCH